MNLDPKALEAAAKALFDSVFDKLDWHKVEYQELYRKHAKSAITAYLTAAEKAVDGAAVVSGSPVSVGDVRRLYKHPMRLCRRRSLPHTCNTQFYTRWRIIISPKPFQ